MSLSSRSASLRKWFNRRGWIKITIATPYIWLALFFLLPFVIVMAMSFATRTPTAPPFSFGGDYPVMNTDHYARLFSDDLYIRAYLNSIGNATFATLMCLLIGYPMALGLTRVSRSWRNVLLMLVILPFWTSFLLRVYAWMGLMGTNSWFNKLLTGAYNWIVPSDMALRYIPMMNTGFAVVLVTVYSYLPFMILPLYANLEKLDISLNEAAMDLGSKPFQVFRDVTLPLSVPGIIAGSLLVFIPASGELIIPSLVGSSSRPMIGRVISDEFASARDWPMASAVAVALLLLLVVPLMIYTYYDGKAHEKAQKEAT
ncbi:ABC transporter permease [Defluviimonas aestuarii]|uniref:ABC transporter permease n=1 Tax=Albidovulum aestuarii TaxID=1130726 RepID=UPI00249A5A5C|nr:ABC transporter permease [Defluviimonas aestuarii]MDI3336748.1 ABC transporter permease [Defluviimonas aestuarii]